MAHEWCQDEFRISDDPAQLDLSAVHHFLSDLSYWAQGRTMETVQKTVQNSLCFGIYQGRQQVGFARVVTDYSTFAWLCDVFILPEFRGQGLAKWLMQVIIEHPQLTNLRRFLLATRDAHGLYQTYGGFQPLANPERWMERFQPTSK